MGAEPAKLKPAEPAKPSPSAKTVVPDPRQTGGEPDGVVQVANLVYAGTKSSRCFSDHFLVTAEKESSISTSRRFHAVKLSSENVFEFPLVIMTGEGEFQLTDEERQNLRRYVERGGLLLGLGRLLVAGMGPRLPPRNGRRLPQAGAAGHRHEPSDLPHGLRDPQPCHRARRRSGRWKGSPSAAGWA